VLVAPFTRDRTGLRWHLCGLFRWSTSDQWFTKSTKYNRRPCSHLLRSGSTLLGALALTGDTADSGPVEVFAAPAPGITWNGKALHTTATASGSQLATLPGSQPVTLPALTNWKHTEEAPETQPGYDDSSWQVADKMTSSSTTPPGTLPVLFADDYGFHHGDIRYRGRFRGTASATGFAQWRKPDRPGAWPDEHRRPVR
jgi:hypothetical protein